MGTITRSRSTAMGEQKKFRKASLSSSLSSSSPLSSLSLPLSLLQLILLFVIFDPYYVPQGAGIVGVRIVEGCTVFVVGRKASIDGSVMVSHSNDGEFDTDPRLVKVNAADYGIKSNGGMTQESLLRPIFYTPESYPRYVGYERNISEYFPANSSLLSYQNQNQSSIHISSSSSSSPSSIFEPIGYIPQVSHTYAYLEETYGAVNEKQVGIGESTCSGVFGAAPIRNTGPGTPGTGTTGTALFSIDELTRIAMERSSTAKQAIEIMGSLAEEYGFYGAGQFEGTAESLAVTDPQEAWLFHILADPTGKSAIWVAEKVEDNQFSVIANMFVIREVDPLNKEKYMMSDSVHSVALEYGWWKPTNNEDEDDSGGDGTSLLDFTKIYSDGEYSHKYYSGRRMWSAYRLAAPTMSLPSEYIDLQSDPVYPFSVQPDTLLSQRDLFRFHRDTYTNTQYDLGNGNGGNLAGGPFGSPDRWKAGSNTDESRVNGNWERPIGLYRTSDTYVVQSKQQQHIADNNDLTSFALNSTTASSSTTGTGTTTTATGGVGAILWFGPSSALATVFTPFIVGLSNIPKSFRSGHQSVFSRESAFWASCYVHNIANLKWSYMITDIQKKQNELETLSVALVAEIEQQQIDNNMNDMKLIIEEKLLKNAEQIVASLWYLADELMFKYADGFVNYHDDDASSSESKSESVGYPTWWLEKVGYKDGPPPPPTKPKCCNPPKHNNSSSTTPTPATDSLTATITTIVDHSMGYMQPLPSFSSSSSSLSLRGTTDKYYDSDETINNDNDNKKAATITK